MSIYFPWRGCYSFEGSGSGSVSSSSCRIVQTGQPHEGAVVMGVLGLQVGDDDLQAGGIRTDRVDVHPQDISGQDEAIRSIDD